MNEVTQWLQSLGLAEYAPAFVEHGIELELLPQLGDADLKELGVAMLGHRKRLLLAIAGLDASGGKITVIGEPQPLREAERRQLTVMFCDLVGSTLLAGSLDPEDLQALIRNYHATVATAVSPYDGYVAQLLGDGCLVYFGYPFAHEDDARRAVHAALNLLKAVAGLRAKGGTTLQSRIGIATGLVVVGEIGAGTPAAEQTASGETPNLAARLQAQASPGEIVVSDATRNLAGAAFEFVTAGELRLKGFAESVRAWRVRGERIAASRFEAQHESELLQFIGRTSEVSLLLERWNLACDGEGQVMLLSGEAGIGKSRICQSLRERLAGEKHATVVLQCSPYHGSSALHPLVQYFERAAGITPADEPQLRGHKLEQLLGPEMELPAVSHRALLRLMGASNGAAAPAIEDDLQREATQTLQAPIDLLRALSLRLPVLLLIEDAHWIDPTTEKLISLATELSRDSRLLLLITARPEYTPPWGSPANLTRLALNRLGQRQSAELVAAVTGGRPLPAEVLRQIIAKTDGIPLFVEELTKTILQSGVLEETEDGYRLRGSLQTLTIPSTLQDSLMARLDRLGSAKEVAQVGAMIGREFSESLMAAVLGLESTRLAKALAELVHSGLVTRSSVTTEPLYTFRHALIRDTAYNSLLKTQRVLRHGQIAAAIGLLEPDIVATQPELLAYHCQEGGKIDDAFGHWLAAGNLAAGRLANREALDHYQAALALLPALTLKDDTENLELELQLKLGNLLMQTEGFGSEKTVASFSRARELASRLGKSDECFLACSGIAASLWSAGRFDDVLGLLGQLAGDDSMRLRPMNRVVLTFLNGLVKLSLGALGEARAATIETLRELALIPFAERQDVNGIDLMVLALSQRVSISVHEGLLDQADADTLVALQIAHERDHAPTRAWALSMARWMAFRQGEIEESIRLSRQVLELSERMGFETRIGSNRILMGRAVVASGRLDEGTQLLREGFAMWTSPGTRTGTSELATIAADVLIRAGRMTDAEAFVLAGEKALVEMPERQFAAELARLRARLLESAGDHRAAEAGFRRAMAIAADQGARLFTLRAATDLAALLHSQGRSSDAQAVLQPSLNALPEGLEQPDAMRARLILKALVSGEHPTSEHSA